MSREHRCGDAVEILKEKSRRFGFPKFQGETKFEALEVHYIVRDSYLLTLS